MDYPPLWIWGIIVGIIIGTKVILRWHGLKKIDRQVIDNPEHNDEIKNAYMNNSGVKSRKLRDIRSYKYGPFGLFRGSFSRRKEKGRQ